MVQVEMTEEEPSLKKFLVVVKNVYSKRREFIYR